MDSLILANVMHTFINEGYRIWLILSIISWITEVSVFKENSTDTDKILYSPVLNPHLPNRLFHPYQLDESILNFRGVW